MWWDGRDGEGARSREHDARFAEWDATLREGAVKAAAAEAAEARSYLMEGDQRAPGAAARSGGLLPDTSAGGRDPLMDTGGAGAFHGRAQLPVESPPGQPLQQLQAQHAAGSARLGAQPRGGGATGGPARNSRQMWGGGPEEGARLGQEATLLQLEEEEKAAVDWEMRLKRSDANAKRARKLQKKAFAQRDGQDDLQTKETKKAIRKQLKAERKLATKSAKKLLKSQGGDKAGKRRRGDRHRSRRRGDAGGEDREREGAGDEEEGDLRRLRRGDAAGGAGDPPLRRPGVDMVPAPVETSEPAPRVGRRGGGALLLEGTLALALLALALRHWWRRGGLGPRPSALHAKRGVLVANAGGGAEAAPSTPEAAGRKPRAAAQAKRTPERTPEPPVVNKLSSKWAGSALLPPPSPNPVASSSDDSGMRSAACTAGTYPSGCSTTSALLTPPRSSGCVEWPRAASKVRQPRAPPLRRGCAHRRRPVAGQRSSGESVSPSTNRETENSQEGNPIVPGTFFIGEESDQEKVPAPRGREPTQGSYLIRADSDVSSSDVDDDTLASIPSAPEAGVPSESEPTDMGSRTRRMTRAVRRMLGLRLAAAAAGRQAGDAEPLAALGDFVSERVEASERDSVVEYQEAVLERTASPRARAQRPGGAGSLAAAGVAEAPRAPSPPPSGCLSVPPAPAAAGPKRPKPPGPAPPKRAAAAPAAAPLRKSLITAKLKPLKSVEGTIFASAGYSPDEQLLEAVLGSKSSAATPREVFARRGSKALLVLDGRRAQNIAIALRGARVRADKVVSALQNMDCHMLEEGVAEALAPVFPTPDEAARLAGYAGERMKLLRDIEQEAAALSTVPRGGARAWLLGATLNMDATTQRSQAALRSARLACVEIHASRRLRIVIQKILGAAQRALSAFDAPGFTLCGMVQLLDAKGTSGRSILHYVCLECRASDPRFLESLLAELRRVPRAAVAQIHTVQEQTQDLERISRAALAELAGGHEEYASSGGATARAALIGIVARSAASARSMRRSIERTGRVLAELERFLGHDRSKAACKGVTTQLDTSAIAIVKSLLERFSRAWAEVNLRNKELGQHSESGGSCSEAASARHPRPCESAGSASSCAASAGEAAAKRRGWPQSSGQAAVAAAAALQDTKDCASGPRPGTPAVGGTPWERQPSASTAAPSSADFVEASAYQVAFDDPLASPRLFDDPLASDDPSTEADLADTASRQATTTTGSGCNCSQTSSAALASRGGGLVEGAE